MKFWTKPKRKKGPFNAVPMDGIGDLGEQQQARQKYLHEPGRLEDFAKSAFQTSKTPPKSPTHRSPKLDPLEVIGESTMRGSPVERVLPLTRASRIEIMYRTIGATKPLQIDVEMKDRTDILIANMSDVVIWLNTHTQFGANRGYPLAPNTAAGAFNGATLAVECTEKVKWYAIAASGATNAIVVIEASR